jgi:C1A family cysteine protease
MAADAINHCVMATGFNTTAETPYWIVRNSWASTWGEAGYIYLEMAENTCGVANRVTIPHVKGWAHPAFSYEEADAAAWREAAYQLATQGTPAI